jgi:PD-(D/E)XK endonuclease
VAGLPNPERPLSRHPVDVGGRTEAIVLAELVRRGYRVLVPFGFNHRYDLVVDVGGRFLRVQCKTGRLRNGRVVFHTRSVRANRSGWFDRSYEGEADLFAVYCPELRRLYAVPIEVAPRGSGTLRIAPAANNQCRGIRWAADFEVPA